MNKSKCIHLKSIGLKKLDESVIRKYIIPNPIFNQIDKIMKRYTPIENIKYERYLVSCVIKLITTKHRVRYNIIIKKLNLDYFFNFSKNSIMSRINQDRYYFSHIYEKRITFSSFFRDMTDDYYLKQTFSMCEVRLNQILPENPRLIYLLSRFSSNPYTGKCQHQEI